MKPLITLLYSALLCALAIPSQAQQALRVSAIPDEAPTELLRKFTPLGAYLEKEVGMKIAWTPVNDYPAVVEGLAGRKLDLAWLGGFTFVQVRLRTGDANPIISARRMKSSPASTSWLRRAARRRYRT